MSDIAVPSTLSAQHARAGVPRWATLGVVFGLLSTAAIALYGPIGVSGTYPRFVGAVLRTVTPDYATSNPYLVKMGSLVTPETMLVVGLLIGGFAAAIAGGTRAPRAEAIHAAGTSDRHRYRQAFIGGVFIIFGARLAGGCTSGHIISGITQLAVSGVLFGAAVFGAGMLTARVLQRGER